MTKANLERGVDLEPRIRWEWAGVKRPELLGCLLDEQELACSRICVGFR